MQPLVTIVCLCYNHEAFLAEALDSVLAQTYTPLEIIVVDDASTDGSVGVIEAYRRQHPEIKFIRNRQNSGNCASFNQAWKASRGQFLIDFATDDVMLPERVAEQVRAFETLDARYGVVYTDAERIDEQGRPAGFHVRRDQAGVPLWMPPSGDIFAEVLRRYFIDATSMMMRREVLEALGGYDASLAYEDFDFWVRSSRIFRYYYLDRVLTKRRGHPRSLSRQVYRPGDRQLASTVRVCYKAAELVESAEERASLRTRVQYELRHAFFSENFREAEELFVLLKRLGPPGLPYRGLHWLTKGQVRLGWARRLYLKIRYGR